MKNANRVLIVDDSSIMRKLIERNLGILNLEIAGMAADGKSAIDLFERTRPDIVTLDLSLPQMDGLEVLATMLRIKNDTRIVVISGDTDKTTGLKALKLGARAFLAKPFSPEQIREALKKLIS